MMDHSLVQSLFLDSPLDLNTHHSTSRVKQPHLPAGAFTFAVVGCDLLIVALLTAPLAHLPIQNHTVLLPSAAVTLTLAAVCILIYASGFHKTEIIANFGRYLRRLSRVLPLLLLALVYAELAWLSYLRLIAPSSLMHDGFIIAAWFGLVLAGVTAWRYAASRLYRHFTDTGMIRHNVVVLGTTETAQAFIDGLRRANLGARVEAVFDESAHNSAVKTFNGVPVRGGIAALLNFHKHHAIDTVAVALPLQNQEEIAILVRRLSWQPLQVRLVPEPFTFEIPPHLCAPAGEIPGMQLLRLADPPIELRGQIVKTLFDKCAALAALLLFGPLMLACAAIIKITSPGPVLFQQPRVGLRNRTFMMYKFRSMHMKDCGHSVLTSRNDSRIFPFGHILRKLSLDELPQLFNVLKGDMSMVGPRPHMPQARAAGALYYDIVPDYAARHRVKPGITGWAQVNGWRGPTETVEQIENRVRYDIYYVENWSLWLDVKILFRTAKVGFFGKNAF